MAHVVTNKGKALLLGAGDWTAGTFKIALATGTYTPTVDHNFMTDVTNELSGGGYARQTLATRTVLEDDTNDRADLKADNVAYSGLTSTQTYRWAVIFRFVTTDADSEIIAVIDMGAGGINLTGITDHTIKWDGQASNGAIVRLS